MIPSPFLTRLTAFIGNVGAMLVLLSLFLPYFSSSLPGGPVVAVIPTWRMITLYAWWGNIVYVLCYMAAIWLFALAILIPLLTNITLLFMRREGVQLMPLSLSLVSVGLSMCTFFDAFNLLLAMLALEHGPPYHTRSIGPGFWLPLCGFILCLGSGLWLIAGMTAARRREERQRTLR